MSEQTLKTVKPEAEIRISKEDIEQIVKSVSCLVEEIHFTIDVDGLTVRQLDPSHVAMIDVSLPNTCFEKYDVESEFNFALKSDELLKMIKMFDKNTYITFNINTEYKRVILSNKSEKYTIHFDESTKNDTPLPKIPYDSKVDFDQIVSTKDFIKTLEKIQVVSDYVTFETSNNRINLSGKGDSGQAENSFERGQVSIACRQVTNATYSFEYLIPFLKTVKENPLTLEYSSVKPIRLESKISNIGKLHYYIAPRVET